MDYKLAGLLTYPDSLSPSHPIKTKTVACGTKSILSGTSGSKFTAAETVADSHGIPSFIAKIMTETLANQFGCKSMQYLRQKKQLTSLKYVPKYYFYTSPNL